MTSRTADPERSRVEPTSTTPGGTWRAEAPTSGRPLGWERCLLWGVLVAAAAVVLFPAGGGAVVRLFGGAPSALPLLVALIMVFGVVQLGRLSCFMGDRDLRWGSAYPPVDEGVEHMCMAAYLQAADLARQGDANICAEHHYPVYGGDPPGHSADAETRVKNMGPYIEDPYEYPPQFLLLPYSA